MRMFRGLYAVLAVLFLIIGIFTVQPTSAGASVCGNGILEIGEVCDDGSQNSDSRPNACRTDCRAAYCGDSVLDSGEECDSGQASYYPLSHPNAKTTPNSCRDGCKLPRCGDGIADSSYNEECDDGNNNDLDGCKSDCTTCLQLASNINMTSDTTLCRQVFNVDDYGPEGVIVIQFPGVTLNCDGATLQGSGGNVGIYVMQSSNVTVKNCTVTGYDVGIKIVDSLNVHFAGYGNNLSGNTETVVLDNSQLAPPKPMESVVSGMVGGGNLPITKQSQPQPQGRKKLQPGGSLPGLIKPQSGGRSNLLPGRQPTIRKPGKPVAPLGTPSPGRGIVKGLSPAPPAKSGAPPVPGAPVMKPGTIGSPPAQQKTTTSTKTLPQKSMPIDPFGKSSLPVEPLAPQIQIGR